MTNVATTSDVLEEPQEPLVLRLINVESDEERNHEAGRDVAPSMSSWAATVAPGVLGYEIEEISDWARPMVDAVERWNALLFRLGMADLTITADLLEPWVDDAREATETYGGFLDEGWPSE